MPHRARACASPLAGPSDIARPLPAPCPSAARADDEEEAADLVALATADGSRFNRWQADFKPLGVLGKGGQLELLVERRRARVCVCMCVCAHVLRRYSCTKSPMSSGAPAAAADAAPRVSIIMCGKATDDVSWAQEAFSSRRDVSLSVYLQPAAPLDWDESAKTGGGEALCFLRHIMTSSDAIGDITVFAAASPRCGSPYPAATAGCIPLFVRLIGALASGAATVEPLGFAPLLSPFPRLPFNSEMPPSAGCLAPQYATLTGRDLNEDHPFLTFVPGGAFAVKRANLMAAPHEWLRQAANQTSGASFYDPVDNCCQADKTCVPWLLERLWPTVFAAPMRTCGDTEVLMGNRAATALCADQRVAQGTSVEMRLNISRISRVALFGNGLRDQEASSVLDLVTHETQFERLRSSGRWAATRKGDCNKRLCKIFSALNAGRDGDKQPLRTYL